MSNDNREHDDNSIVPFSDSTDLSKTMRGIGKVLIEVSNKLETMETSQKKTETTMTGVVDTVNDLVTDVDDLKNNQFVEPWQDANINKAARIRVSNLLEIRWVNGGVVDECMHDYKVYFGKFLRALHGDMKKIGLEGRKIHQTQRKDYPRLIEEIGKWVPVRGVEGQKEYYDSLAKA